MKSTISQNKNTEHLLLFLLLSLILTAPLFIFQQSGQMDWTKVYSNWKSIAPFLILLLFNHFVLVPLLLFKNKKQAYFISAILFILIFSFTLHFIAKGKDKPLIEDRPFPPPHILNEDRPNKPPIHLQEQRRAFAYPPYISTFIISILLIGFDTGFRMNFRWSKLEQERTELEKENVENQLAFLKNQVSPHFFMNTLNNIHSLIDVNTEEAKEAIIKLSKLMRHLLYDSEAEKIPIKNELDFISSYINLMKLRFSEKVNINLEIPNNVPQKSIPPLLFTSFVENAFKHGISYQKTSYIHIRFQFTDDSLIFILNNSLSDKKNIESGGIGIDNSRKRLDILFGNNYQLDIEESQTEYHLTLNIPL